MTASVVSGFAGKLLAGLDDKKFKYVGGTWTQVKQESEGKLDLSDAKVARFKFDKSGDVEMPFDNITSLEYGQKAGRRVGATIGWGVTTLGIAALPILFSKKRKHFFSIGYRGEDGSNQGVVLELGKNITRATLKTFETRSGKEIEYESEDARKNIGN
jgi:hypothetical protein